MMIHIEERSLAVSLETAASLAVTAGS
jgi:hypothetical protein